MQQAIQPCARLVNSMQGCLTDVRLLSQAAPKKQNQHKLHSAGLKVLRRDLEGLAHLFVTDRKSTSCQRNTSMHTGVVSTWHAP